MPEPTDVLVGAKVRELRRALGFTQTRLAKEIGTTFQQVQKYEKGTNRISASRLQGIAKALNTTPSYFFQDGPTTSHRDLSLEVVEFLRTPESMRFTRAFLKIADPAVRERALHLVMTIADMER